MIKNFKPKFIAIKMEEKNNLQTKKPYTMKSTILADDNNMYIFRFSKELEGFNNPKSCGSLTTNWDWFKKRQYTIRNKKGEILGYEYSIYELEKIFAKNLKGAVEKANYKCILNCNNY